MNEIAREGRGFAGWGSRSIRGGKGQGWGDSPLRNGGHAHRAAALGIEDERSELARQRQRETFRDEDQFAPSGDDDRALVGGEDLFDRTVIGRSGEIGGGLQLNARVFAGEI